MEKVGKGISNVLSSQRILRLYSSFIDPFFNFFFHSVEGLGKKNTFGCCFISMTNDFPFQRETNANPLYMPIAAIPYLFTFKIITNSTLKFNMFKKKKKPQLCVSDIVFNMGTGGTGEGVDSFG